MEGQEVIGNVVLENNWCDFVIRDIRVLSILRHIFHRDRIRFSELISKTRPFGLRKDLFNNPEKYPNLYLSIEPFENSVKVFGVKGKKGGAKRTFGYISPIDLTDRYDALNRYKLFFTTSYSSDAIIPPEHIKSLPNEICTETFLVVGPFDNEEEMNNCSLYMETCFFRFLLFLGHGTMQVNKNVFGLIPIQDFTQNSDIDWKLSIAEIERQLYHKYGLENTEIDFIERKIKSKE